MDEVFTLTQAEKGSSLPIMYQKNYSVTQANELVRSRQDDLSLLEAKLIRLVIAQVVKEDTDLKTYTCKASQLAEFLGISRQAVNKARGKAEVEIGNKDSSETVSDLEAFCKNLMRKTIHIRRKGSKGKSSFKMFQWVSSADYEDGVITIKLHDDLKPYLLGLNELFTSYGYEEILKLHTYYAIRLFELLYSYSSMAAQNEDSEVVIEIEALREYFNCIDKYPQTGDFIKRVIKTAKEDIVNNTNLPCEYFPIKERNRITKIRFVVGEWNSEAGRRIIKRLRSCPA